MVYGEEGREGRGNTGVVPPPTSLEMSTAEGPLRVSSLAQSGTGQQPGRSHHHHVSLSTPYIVLNSTS